MMDLADDRQRPLAEVKADLFKALAHPARVRALELLAEGEHSVTELQAEIGIESSHLSQQLAVLRRAGLVTTRREGATVHYAVKSPLVVELLAAAKAVLVASLRATQDLLAELDDDLTRR